MSDATRNQPDEGEVDRDAHVTELLGGYALGALDSDEMELVANHVRECAECQAELTVYQDVTNLLAYASPVHHVPVRARGELLRRIDGIGTANQQQMIVLPASTPRRERTWLPARPSLPRIAAFAGAPLLVALALVIVMADVISDKQQEIEQIQEQQGAFTSSLANALATPNTDRRLVPSGPAQDAQGRLLIDWEMNRILLLVVGLPNLEDGQQYVPWLHIRGADEYARHAPLVVDEIGRANTIVEPNGSIGDYETLIVTIESDANSPIPIGTLVMSSDIPPSH